MPEKKDILLIYHGNSVEFYERAGRVQTPMAKMAQLQLSVRFPHLMRHIRTQSQGTLRIGQGILGSDVSLARQRHFPAINWLSSYSLYPQSLNQWLEIISLKISPRLEHRSWFASRRRNYKKLFN